jgi:Uma2 family endonuclease
MIQRMASVHVETRRFEPGTTGWTVDDLEDPAIERQWFNGPYEIVDGVLTKMPPAYFAGGESLYTLMKMVDAHATSLGTKVRFSTEVDIVCSRRRVARSDAAMLLPDDTARQKAAARKVGKTDLKRTRIYVPPTLVIESMSVGHEDHDREVKRVWYAEFGVPHYWLLDAFQETLQCLQLNAGSYEVDAEGKGAVSIQPSLFAGLRLNLKELWGDDTESV